MNENLNLVEILKDCPKGIELYSPMYGLGILTKVTNRIHVKFPKEHNVKCFRPDGKVSEDGEIMLFPKGKTTWEGFQRPFVDGDVIVGEDYIGLYETYRKGNIITHCSIDENLNFILGEVYYCFGVERLATEEEKQKLFKAIQENGYKWNVEEKKLEKLIVPKFKVGDKVRNKANGRMTGTIFALYEEVYEVKNPLGNEFSLDFRNQDGFELVPNKFDPKTLQPFDKVLVSCNDEWFCDFFSHYDDAVNKFNCTCTGGCPYSCCIPYNDDTKHLIGKTIEDAPEFYRYWEE